MKKMPELIIMRKIKYILIICTGNTARSPVGEYLGNYYAKMYNVDLIFDSAGFINAFSYMQPESQKYLKFKGINFSNFNPKIIDKELLSKQDLILTMESSHAQEIIQKFRDIKNIAKKTFTLKQFNGETDNIDILDPYYTTIEIYRKVLRIIDKNIEKAVKRIIKSNIMEDK
jgi:protein-tyrosine phosphatase